MFPTITLPGPKLITFRLLCGIVELCKRSIQEQLCALLSQFAVVVKCSPGTSFELVKSNNTFCWNIVLRDCVTPTAWHSHASQLTLSQCALRGKRPYDAGDMHLYRYLYHTYLITYYYWFLRTRRPTNDANVPRLLLLFESVSIVTTPSN